MKYFKPTEEQKKKLLLIEQRSKEYREYWASRLGSTERKNEREPVLLADILNKSHYARRARELVSEHPRAEYPTPIESYDCQKCKDTGRLQIIIPDEIIPRYIWCPNCSLERKKRIFEQNWPLTPWMLEFSEKPLHSLTKQTDEPFNKALKVCKALVSRRFPAALVLLTGDSSPGYGTGKSHLLARLWAAAWKIGMTCILTSSPKLERRFTQFGDEEERTRILNMLHNVDVLLVDEAHRLTVRDGNGWTERNLFSLINHLLENNKTIVLASNSLSGIHPGIINRAKDSERGGIMIDLSSVSSYRERHAGVPEWLRGIPL